MNDPSVSTGDLRAKFTELCSDTDISSELIDETWTNYTKLNFAFSLEVTV
jgi:hypothetical protein